MGNDAELSLKKYIRTLLAEGKVEKALKALRQNYPSDNNLLQLSARYHQYKEDKILMLVSSDELDRKINGITYALTEHIDSLMEKQNFNYIEEEPENEKEEKKAETFSNWFVNETKNKFASRIFVLGTAIGFFLWIIALSIGMVGFGKPLEENNSDNPFLKFTLISIGTHIVLSWVAIRTIGKIQLLDYVKSSFDVFLKYDQEDIKRYIGNSEKIISEFKLCWKFTWIGWFFLYLLLGTKYWLEPILIAKQNAHPYNYFYSLIANVDWSKFEWYLNIFVNLFRNFSTLGIIGCFSILYFKKSSNSKNHYNNIATQTTFAILLILTFFELFFVQHDNDKSDMFFQIVTLLLFALSLCLLTSRLEGKLINTPIVFSIIFYLYAATQISSALLVKSDRIIITAFSLNFSLFAKGLLFLYILWLVEIGKLKKYIIRLSGIVEINKKEII